MAISTVDHLPAAALWGRNLGIVGGGAGSLERVTRLGDMLGRRGRADVAPIEKARLWKPPLHEVAAAGASVA